MDLNLARLFLRVVDAGSFTAAAAVARVPKSSLSRAVARLEAEVGARLLERTTRKLVVTAAGRTLYDAARAAVGTLEEAERAVAESLGEPRGLVRFTAPLELDRDCLAALIGRFVDEHPRIEVETILTNRLVDLAAESVDVALRAGRTIDESLIARRVGTDSGGLFAAPAYLRRRGRPRAPADLATHPFVRYQPRGPSGALTLYGPSGSERIAVTGRVATDELGLSRALAVAGLGIAVLPLRYGAEEVTRGRLEHVLPEWTFGTSRIWVVTRARDVPRRVTLFRDHLVATVGDLITRVDAGAPSLDTPKRPSTKRRPRATPPRRRAPGRR